MLAQEPNLLLQMLLSVDMYQLTNS